MHIPMEFIVGTRTNAFAHVIRVMPEEEEATWFKGMLYRELIKFMKYSMVNYLELSKLNYARLQQLVGKQPEEHWTDDDRREFSSIRCHFRKAYEALRGNKLTSTCGDALVALIEVYGYPLIRNSTEDRIKDMPGKAWEKITLQQHDIAIDLKLDPGEESKPWTQAHEHGREYAQQVLGAQMVNPRAKVYLEWFTNGDPAALAFPMLNWGICCETLLRRILDRSLQSEYEQNGKAANYSWGMSAGVVGVNYSEQLPDGTQNPAGRLQDLMRYGISHPFTGKNRVQGSGLTIGQILTMNWLAENIEGSLPDII